VDVNVDRWIMFAPRTGSLSTGFIFYLGGRVPEEAYAPLGKGLAEAGYLAVLVPMPFDLAILAPHAADDVIDNFPEVRRWVVGGHSLGGVMAARYTVNQAERVHGLVLMAAYPESNNDLRGLNLPVVTIDGERDGLTSVDDIEHSLALLPAKTRRVLINGGNHAQFGWYGNQSDDNPAMISRDKQYSQVIEATIAVLREAGD
jgi:pimeloyl-ACP methyl ester carboxylesterase